MHELHRSVDTLIIGGGTTGAALAGLLAERSDESILVLEAGPDFGPFEARRLAGGRARCDVARRVAPARLRQRRRLPRAARRVPARRHDRRLLQSQRLRRDLGQPPRLRRLRGSRDGGLVACRTWSLCLLSRERAYARAHPGGGRAGAVPSCCAGVADGTRRPTRPRPQRPRCRHRRRPLARQHRRRRALECRAGLSRPGTGASVAADRRRCPGRAARGAERARARRRRASRGRARRRGGARDRVCRRLRLPRAPAALGHRACGRPAGARHPRGR